MVQFRLLLLPFISIVLAPKRLVVAFPHLTPRQSDDIWDIRNIPWDQAGEQVLNGLDFGIGAISTGFGALGTALHDFVQTPDQQDTTTTTVPEVKLIPGTAPSGPLFPGVNNGLDQPPGPPEAPTQPPSTPAPQCDSANIVSSDCGKVLNQLIFTTGCDKITKDQRPTAIAETVNVAIQAALMTMDPGVKTSRSGYCGVFMFMARLTAEQSRQISRMPGVSHVSSDIAFDASDKSTNSPQPQPGVLEPAFKRGRLRKRDTVRQQAAPAHLRLLSTPKTSQRISADYVYDSTAGADTVVFSVGPGVRRNHPEFQYSQIAPDDIILAADVDMGTGYLSESEDPDGTCVASLIMGRTYGVSKRTKLKPVLINPSVGSLISGLIGVGEYFLDREDMPGPPVLGFVMLLGMAWRNADEVAQSNFIRILDFLMYGHDVVVVAAAGVRNVAGQMDSYPAVLSLTTPVIAVGAVDIDGAMFPWSPLAKGLISAPGEVECASNDGGSEVTIHPFMAAAQVAGLAAYNLGLYPNLRADQNPELGAAVAVRMDMLKYAWARVPGGPVSIWNRLGP